MIDPNVKGFNPGALKDREDPRDYQYSEIAQAAGSAPFDWNKGYDIEEEIGKAIGKAFEMPIKDQNGSGSCGGQAWSYYVGAAEALLTKSFEERSAKYIYAQTYVPPAGSWGRSNSDICINQGVAREALLSSYNNGVPPAEAFMQRPQDITPAMRADASSSKAAMYSNVDISIDKVAQAIRDNGGVVIGITGVNNGTWGSEFPKPPAGSALADRWYHWMYFGKAQMRNGKKMIGSCNSWGKYTGNKGWQWVGEDYFKCALPGDFHGSFAIWQIWTLTYNEKPVTEFKHKFEKQLKLGNTGEEVRALQMALQVDGSFPAGYPLGKSEYPNPYYGDITRQAVLKFQLKHNVAPASELYALNGKEVGPKTRAKLNELFAN